ncbi:hypothetical protein NCS52_00217400 [Fusarium sp. LHS14.1]|nr:hypothetical protein NCS52_00217400 [Fusarium sp. LHS14.1]
MGTTLEPQWKAPDEDVGFEGDFDFADVFEPSWDSKKPDLESPETQLREIKVGIKKAMIAKKNAGKVRTRPDTSTISKFATTYDSSLKPPDQGLLSR